MQKWIQEIDPNVTLYSLPVCDDDSSYANLWDQGQQIIDGIRHQIALAPEVFEDGYTLVAHSQGALTARTAVQRMDDHNVHTLICLAGPQLGEFGIPDISSDNALFQDLAAAGRDSVYTLVLTGLLRSEFQESLSVANYWSDPRPSAGLFEIGKPRADYLSGNTFLPVLNNEPERGTQGPGLPVDASEAVRYKGNFLRLRRAVFTAGTADEMIIPWNSGVWEFFEETGTSTVPLNETSLWLDDWVGLRELHETGRLVREVGDGVAHTMWAHDRGVFDSFVAPHLPSHGDMSLIV